MHFGDSSKGWESIYKGLMNPFDNKFRNWVNDSLKEKSGLNPFSNEQ